MPWAKVVPVLLDCSPGDLCRRPYPNHKRGCPNYNQRGACPPKAFLWTLEWIAEREFYAIWNVFPFGAHVERMRTKHPDWSQRQLECCLYWQGTARKQLRAEVDDFMGAYKGRFRPSVEYIPEAHGANVTETMRRIDEWYGGSVELEWPPKTITHQVAIAITCP